MSCKAPHELRTEACNLAAKNMVRAVAIAGEINDPWYAAQAFAWCGRFAPEPEFSSFIDESFRQAARGKDAYQQLAAAAWPMRALIEIGHAEKAWARFAAVSKLIADVKPPSSRAEGSYLVFQAMAVGTKETAGRAYLWLLSSNSPIEHWRQERAVRSATIQAVELGLVSADDLETLLADERLANQITTRISRGEIHPPRAFFWSRG